MEKNLFFLPKRKSAAVAITFVLLASSLISEAQFVFPGIKKKDIKIDDITHAVNSVADLVFSVKNLIGVCKMPTPEFNKNVRVVTGKAGKINEFPKDVPRDQFTKPKYKRKKFTNFTWTPVSFFDGQLFPSSIICMATYKGKLEGKLEAISRPIGFTIASKHANIPLNWEIECVGEKYFPKLTGSYFYREANKIVELMPEVTWNFEALAKNYASTPISVVFRVFDEEGNKVEKVKHLYLKSVNECIYQYTDVGMDFLFTGYIQEEHPEIDKILKQAKNTKMIKNFTGYHGSEENTTLQVAAIWRVLHDRGFAYSDVSQTVGATDNTQNIKSQTVRTFDNSIKTSQANCIDGTIVFASILRRIGISTVLVITSDHCFLGYYTDKAKKKIYYVETTFLSESDLIDKAKTKDAKNKAYRKEFDNARKYAYKEYDEYKAKNDILEIDVDMMRKVVKPIPFYID